MIGIMRHGKTEWNVLHKIQGRTDIPLNEEGKKAAFDAVDRYKDLKFDICYVSPLIRARETADIFLKDRNCELKVDDRITELSFGNFEGTANIYSMPDHPLYKLFFDTENYVAVNGAESLDDLYKRVGSFIDDCLKPCIEEDKNVLVLAHGALNACLINSLINNPRKDYWKYGQNNCEIFKFYPDDMELTLRINKKSIRL